MTRRTLILSVVFATVVLLGITHRVSAQVHQGRPIRTSTYSYYYYPPSQPYYAPQPYYAQPYYAQPYYDPWWYSAAWYYPWYYPRAYGWYRPAVNVGYYGGHWGFAAHVGFGGHVGFAGHVGFVGRAGGRSFGHR